MTDSVVFLVSSRLLLFLLLVVGFSDLTTDEGFLSVIELGPEEDRALIVIEVFEGQRPFRFILI